ncbi:hypothetical protein J2754_000462 [Halarchaeum solikamskense]|uniref:hypothetical protein n=1 Tax=Halarchaeum nitratireducens TaxID=489913 RepID=UPI001B3A936B|nr:hypothetical protein [Halarchaeum solikamskense]MBP2250165.1 hypothetical protein [Halarchaeum solikamskense]
MEPVDATDLDWTGTDTDRMTVRRKKLSAAAGGDARSYAEATSAESTAREEADETG